MKTTFKKSLSRTIEKHDWNVNYHREKLSMLFQMAKMFPEKDYTWEMQHHTNELEDATLIVTALKKLQDES